jgi:hypothetical protein
LYGNPQSESKQGFVSFESTPANEISFVDYYKKTLSKRCVDPLRPPAIPVSALRDLQANEIRLAALEVPSGIDSDTAAAIRVSIDRAFIFGFRFIMLICAGLCLASAAVAWRMIARPNLNYR